MRVGIPFGMGSQNYVLLQRPDQPVKSTLAQPMKDVAAFGFDGDWNGVAQAFVLQSESRSRL
ncbi:hypothetical protein NAP1_03775 [Erythrobacter sp. NAP1]|nr:hypothetical protein NAP1_03775 [Erythrobacter sp. NAP1]